MESTGIQSSRCGSWEPTNRQESVGLLAFEPILVDSQALDSGVKGWSWKPQFCGRAVWSADAASAFRQSGLNHLLCLPLQGTTEGNCRTSGSWRLAFEPGFIHGENVTFVQDYGSLNYVLKFTHIARPLVGV